MSTSQSSSPDATATATESSNGAADTNRLPLHGLLDALDGWYREQNGLSRERLAASFGAVVAAGGLVGGYLRVSMRLLPNVEIGCGTLAAGAVEAAPGIEQFELRSGARSLGSAWLDPTGAPAGAAAETARAIELTLDAAWSRVRARHAAEELAALDSATRAIAGVLDLDRVLQLITDRVRELAHAQYAALGIVDQEGVIERFVTSGISRADRERLGPPPRGHGLLGVIVAENTSLRVSDVNVDPRRHGFPPGHPTMTSLLGVPVGLKGHSIGRLYVTNKQPTGAFTEDDQRVVEMFAVHAAIAIENARLHEQVQRLAIVEERERIGRDLHDGIIQSIYAVGLSLEDVPDLMEDEPEVARQRVERAIESLDQSIRDIRNFIFGLRPELLEQAGLIGGLFALADEFRVNSLVDIDIDTSGAEDPDLPADHVGQLLAIAREALSNIARHSKATRGSIIVNEQDGRVRLVISDNGVGFEPDRPRGPSHQGIVNMHARVAEIGGRLEVDSRSGGGTRIIVDVPSRDGEAGDVDRMVGAPLPATDADAGAAATKADAANSSAPGDA